MIFLLVFSVISPEVDVSQLQETASPSLQIVVEELGASPSAYPVIKVLDGDTIAVNLDNKNEVVRLVGINTPETVDPRKPVECFGEESSRKLKALLEGKVVSLEGDATQSDRDRYGRLLRFVFINGEDVGLVMLREGYAAESLYSDVPHKYRDAYLEVQREAQESKRGLWGDRACEGFGEVKGTSTAAPKIETKMPKTSLSKFTPKPSTEDWSCDCTKTCLQMSSCAEAQYQLTVCGCRKRDGDGDGVACESECQ